MCRLTADVISEVAQRATLRPLSVGTQAIAGLCPAGVPRVTSAPPRPLRSRSARNDQSGPGRHAVLATPAGLFWLVMAGRVGTAPHSPRIFRLTSPSSYDSLLWWLAYGRKVDAGRKARHEAPAGQGGNREPQRHKNRGNEANKSLKTKHVNGKTNRKRTPKGAELSAHCAD
jgi:hypothetical protein